MLGFVSRLFSFLGLTWCVWVAFLWVVQDAMVFPLTGVDTGRSWPSDAVIGSWESPDGAVLQHQSVFVDGEPLGTVVAFGGNGQDAGRLLSMLSLHLSGWDVVTIFPRGHGPSRGSPSADHLVSDALGVFDDLSDGFRGDVVVLGVSMGTGPASFVLSHKRVSGGVFITPFSRFVNVARRAAPLAPVSLLFRHDMDAASAVSLSSKPVAVFRVSDDEVIPESEGRDFVESVFNLIVSEVLPDQTHNSFWSHSDFWSDLEAALLKVLYLSTR